MVWAIKLRVGKSQILQRPVNKMVLLLENEIVQFPHEESHAHRKYWWKILEFLGNQMKWPAFSGLTTT